MPTLAVIDIGSNAMRLAIAKSPRPGSIKVTGSYRESVRVGTEVFQRGRISERSMQRAIAAILRFKKIIKASKADLVSAVATSAVREAGNGQNFTSRVQRVTGINVNVIDGKEEARLVHSAVSNVTVLGKKPSLLIDVGGGSIETSLVVGGKVIFSDSVRMGTVRLLQLMKARKTAPKLLQRFVKGYAASVKRRAKRKTGLNKVKQIIGTGGNLEALGELRGILLGKKGNNKVKRSELDTIIEILSGLSYEERIERLGLKPDRADVIVPAAILIQAVMRESGATDLIIPKVGLKDGALLELSEHFAKQKPQISLRTRSKKLRIVAKELGDKYNVEWKHAEHVAKLALSLFRQTKRLHHLSHNEEALLLLAALLHDIGVFVDLVDHHKHSYYILRETPLSGLVKEERLIVAAIARYHRGSSPKNEHEAMQSLNPKQRETVKILSGLLRIAEALDKEHLRVVKDIRLQIKAKKVLCRLIGKGPMLLERWALNEAKKHLESVFHKKLEVAPSA